MMQGKKPSRSSQRPSSQQSQGFDLASLLQMSFLFIITVLPLAAIILLFTTPLNTQVAELFGRGVDSDENLVIYDVFCTPGNGAQFYLTYWTSEAAPFHIEADDIRAAVTIAPAAGIYSMDFRLVNQNECPRVITLIDISRNRRAGRVVEVLE